MPVLSVRLPASREAALGLSCLKYGVEASKIDTAGGVMYADLVGDNLKTLRAAVSVGATPVAVVEYTEAPGAKQGEYGMGGDGIMLDREVDRTATYTRLMKAAR